MNEVGKYLNIVDHLLKASRDQNRNIKTVEEFIKEGQRLTIDNFFKLLYSMFDKHGMLLNDVEASAPLSNKNKFFFSEAYPDSDKVVTNNVVTFQLTSRTPAVLESKIINSSTNQYRPRYVCEVEDSAKDDIYVIYSNDYDNEVTFTCWSEKASDARRMATFLENFFTKYYLQLRTHLGPFHYKGRSTPIVSSDYGDKRLFGIPMKYSIRTEEIGALRQSEIVKIDEYVDINNSSVLEEII